MAQEKRSDLDSLTLLRNFILVKPFSEAKIGSFIIPFMSEKMRMGQIVKLGEGSKSTHDPYAVNYHFRPWEEIGLKVGDVITFGNFYNKKSETVLDGDDYIVMTDFDIECILEDFPLEKINAA